MKIYHGTDQESANKIKKSKFLKGSTQGPGICLNLKQALNYALIKTGNVNYKGVIIVIEDITDKILDNATKDAPDSFTLNDEFGNPSKGLPVQIIKIISIDDAQRLCEFN